MQVLSHCGWHRRHLESWKAPAQSDAPAIALEQKALKRALLELSPAEKLRIAGDRICLAKSVTKPKVQSKQKGRVAVSDQCVTITQTVCPWPARAR
jgi:hypothetical protein